MTGKGPIEAPRAADRAAPSEAQASGKLPIGRDEINRASEILKKYQDSRANLDSRIIANNEWWRLRNWSEIGTPKNPSDPTPSSAWLFNSIANKHADAMDNLPAPIVLARSSDDQGVAAALTKVLPVILEYNDFEGTYDREIWRKNINGAMITGVFWDTDADDVSICGINPLSIYWQPGIDNIQLSANVFTLEWVSNDILSAKYPSLSGRLGGNDQEIKDVRNDDNIDHSSDTCVVDWYYRKDGVIHYCKYAVGQVLFSTENELANGDETYAAGIYEDGEYPFVIDSYFPIENSPFGFGNVDIGKGPQMFIDKLDSLILKSALIGSRQRYFVKVGGGVREEEFADVSNELVHVAGNDLGENSIRPIEKPTLDGIYVTVSDRKIEELKETTGNRDFAQGSTSGGVTSGFAITALQEAGNKLSRDQNKSAYRAYRDVCYKVIERMRQFYTETRYFRITGENGSEYFEFDPRGLRGSEVELAGGELVPKQPIFDIKVVAQKSSPYSREIQNQRATEMYNAGFFAPERAEQALMALSMMDFEGKEDIERKISEQARMFEQIQALSEKVAELSAVINQMSGLGETVEEPKDLSHGRTTKPTPGATPAMDGRMTTSESPSAMTRTNTKGTQEMRERARNTANPG